MIITTNNNECLSVCVSQNATMTPNSWLRDHRNCAPRRQPKWYRQVGRKVAGNYHGCAPNELISPGGSRGLGLNLETYVDQNYQHNNNVLSSNEDQDVDNLAAQPSPGPDTTTAPGTHTCPCMRRLLASARRPERKNKVYLTLMFDYDGVNWFLWRPKCRHSKSAQTDRARGHRRPVTNN